MRELVEWLFSTAATAQKPLSVQLSSHHFLSTHPFNEGNERTGRLLATAELWHSDYRMRGFFSFDEYFNAARDRYCRSLQMGLLLVDFYEGSHSERSHALAALFIETMARPMNCTQSRSNPYCQFTHVYCRFDRFMLPCDS